MALSFRQAEILTRAKQHGKVVVEDLVAHYKVTPQTIRRDLAEMCEAGQLERVYGGAVLPSGVANIGYEERQTLNAEEKARIAALCARSIPDDASLFMNIGTTTEAVARALRDHRNLMVLTNNMNVANILIPSPSCEVVVAGGVARRSDGGLVGEFTADVVRQYKVDFAVIGASAIDADGDLLDFDLREIRVSQIAVAQARATFLVADRSKFRRTAPARIASLEAVDTVFTDAPPPEPIVSRCETWGTRLRIAEGQTPG